MNLDDITAIANMDLKEIENNLFECSYSLALPRALHKDTGTYTIVAKNQYGQDESSVSYFSPSKFLIIDGLF